MISAEQFPQIIRDIERKYRGVYARLPLLLGNEAVNFTLDNFRLQGFMGNSFQRWLPRKKSKWGNRDRTGAAILIQKGRLRRSIRIIRLNADSVTIGTDVKYARAHNEGMSLGLIQTVKGYSTRSGVVRSAHTRRINMRIPRRQFMGDSPYLRARLRRVAIAEFLKDVRFLRA